VQTVEALFSEAKILTILRRFYDCTVICQAPLFYVLERFIDRTDMAGTKGLMLSLDQVFRLKEYYYNFKANFNYL
jgi:hypothetical protein